MNICASLIIPSFRHPEPCEGPKWTIARKDDAAHSLGSFARLRMTNFGRSTR
jgi:hypothetical protein